MASSAIDRLRAAFPATVIDLDVARLDIGYGAETTEEYVAPLVGRTWVDVAPAHLAQFGGALSFLRLEIFLQLLPVYLLAALELPADVRYNIHDSVLVQLTKRAPEDRHLRTGSQNQREFARLTAALSREQHAAIADVLAQYVAAHPDAPSAQRALERYWHAFTTRPEVVTMLRAAFPPGAPDAYIDGTALSPDAPTRERDDFLAWFSGRTWDDLDVRTVVDHAAVLPWLAAESLRLVLPAYARMLVALPPDRDPPAPVFVALTDAGANAQRFAAMIASMTDAQLVAIATAVARFLEEHPASDDARIALDSHWHVYAKRAATT